MKIIKHSLRFVVLLFAAVCTVPTRADFILAFSVDEGASFVTEVSGNVGTQLDIGLFLLQQGSESRLSSDGLLTFGTRATYSDQHVDVTAVSLAPLFSDLSGSTGIISATEFALVGEDPLFVGIRQPSISLGRFTLAMTSVGATSIVFGDFDTRASAGDFVLADFDFTDIDGNLFSSSREGSATDRSRTYTLAVSTVPEPSSLVLVAIGGGLLAMLRRRALCRL